MRACDQMDGIFPEQVSHLQIALANSAAITVLVGGRLIISRPVRGATSDLAATYKNLYTESMTDVGQPSSGSAARGVTFGRFPLCTTAGWVPAAACPAGIGSGRLEADANGRTWRLWNPDLHRRGAPSVLSGDASGRDLRPSRIREGRRRRARTIYAPAASGFVQYRS